MLRVPIKQIEPGMVLAMPVYNPAAPSQPLLRADYEIDAKVVTRLIELDVRDIWVRQPGMEQVMQFIDQKLILKRNDVADSLRGAFDEVQAQTTPKLDYDAYSRKITDMIEHMLTHPASMLYMDDMAESDKPLIDHSMRVAYIAVLMGLKLDAYLIQQRKRLDAWQAQQVTNLGLGAMLHDIGMTKLDEDVRDRYEQTRDTNDELWRKHVQLGWELLGGNIDPSARTCALHHHQHFDGSGFPTKEQADGRITAQSEHQIHVFARIVCVANIFDRLQYPKPGKRLPPVAALHQIFMTERVKWFDPVILRALLKVTPAYPPGTKVELSDGTLAGTLDHTPDAPCRPIVQPLPMQPDGDEGEDTTINLAECDGLTIVKADGITVGDFNFDPPELAEVV